ncbi:MAG: hypothetical protein Q9188_005911 [Gyalolechia gomerana]
MATVQEKKRKESPTTTNAPNRQRNAKRVKIDEARNILTQASDKALNNNGELDVSAFVKAREFEIKAMEASMGASKKALSSRAFQQVPNELRRRTASHNVKKVPKKLRSRAVREMKEDNTPTVTSRRRKPTRHMRLRLETAKSLQKLHARQKKKRAQAHERKAAEGDPEKSAAPAPPIRRLKKNILSKPDEPPSKFRKRQKHKCWLPTHIYHAKRAHMTEPKHPLWRFAIALTPTQKTYRKTHRAGSLRGCVAWDTSYMSTIQVEAVEASLLGLFRGVGVDEDALVNKRHGKWRRGTRSWQGWVRERDGEQKWIARVKIVWCIQHGSSLGTEAAASTTKSAKRRCFVRVHPSAFLQLWTELLKVAKMQRPPVVVEDLRFEIGSLELTGPGSTEALVAALTPLKEREESLEEESAKAWSSLGSVTNPSCLPSNAILSFSVSDPRLHYPPRTIKQPRSESANDELLQVLASWPPDRAQNPPSIFDRTARLTASRLLPSQKAINRRKGDAMPDEYPASAPSDPQIPILLTATCSSTTGGQGSWTLLLPWKCVLPVWYHIMHYPLSTGGNPCFGGLEETRQMAFEHGIPWFPGDFPGTQAGWQWEMMERAKRKADWEKRSKSKRVTWESLDLGHGRKGEIGTGWACDWEYLFNPTSTPPPALDPPSASQATTTDSSTNNQDSSKSTHAVPETSKSQAAVTTLTPHSINHLPLPLSSTILSSPSSPPSNIQHSLTTVHLTLLSRGNPTICARIYRLPTTSPQFRAQWLALANLILHSPPKNQRQPKSSLNISNRNNKILAQLPKNESHPLRTQQTAISLLRTSSHPASAVENHIIQPGDPSYPSVPNKEDLSGFVTTGNFDLGQGKASAIGCIAIGKVVQQPDKQQAGLGSGNEGEDGEEGKAGKAWKAVQELENKLGKKVVGRLCVVRDAGTAVGRLARWELV